VSLLTDLDIAIRADDQTFFITLQKHGQPLQYLLCRLPLPSLQVAFPDLGKAPPSVEQCRPIAGITGNVARDFFMPELPPSSGPPEQMAVVTMPEAAAHLDCGIPGGKYKIRPSRKPAVVQTKSETHPVQAGPDQHLGFRITPPDASHHPAAGRLVDDVRQWPPDAS